MSTEEKTGTLWEVLSEPVAALRAAAKKLGGSVHDASQRFEQAVRKLSDTVHQHTPQNVHETVKSLHEALLKLSEEVKKQVEKHGPHELHLKAIFEAIPALKFIHETKAVQYIEERARAVMTHGNEVLVKFKGTAHKEHEEFVAALQNVLKHLREFAEKHYPAGVPTLPAIKDMITTHYEKRKGDAVTIKEKCWEVAGKVRTDGVVVTLKSHMELLTPYVAMLKPSNFRTVLTYEKISAKVHEEYEKRPALQKHVKTVTDYEQRIVNWAGETRPGAFCKKQYPTVEHYSNAIKAIVSENGTKPDMWVKSIREGVTQLTTVASSEYKNRVTPYMSKVMAMFGVCASTETAEVKKE